MGVHQYIAIDGPIGVGKTTLVKRLSEDLGGTHVLEPEQENPFLTEFYSDRQQNAFKTQLFFLLSRYQQQKGIKRHPELKHPIVCDYTFSKDQIFANANLSKAEKNLYNQVFSLLDRELNKPDIVVYLRAETDVLLERIRARGLPFEKPIDKTYLGSLINEYNEFYLNFEEAPLLIVDTTHTDFVSSHDQYELLKKEILDHRKGSKNLVLR